MTHAHKLSRYPFICVVDIYTGYIAYCGHVGFKSAEAGQPGTTWGYGLTEAMAREIAVNDAKRYRENRS